MWQTKKQKKNSRLYLNPVLGQFAEINEESLLAFFFTLYKTKLRYL